MTDEAPKQGHPKDIQGLFLFYWLPVLIFAAVIFFQSAGPSPLQIDLFDWFDKLVHFVVYAVFGILIYRAVGTTFPEKPQKWILLSSILLGSFYGATDELHQLFVSARNGDFFDFLADTAGVAAGVWLYRRLTASSSPEKPAGTP